MQRGPIRRQTVEFEAIPGWQDAPQTLDAIPLPVVRPRPHAHLRPGAVTFPDVNAMSFRRGSDVSWRELLPYSVAGFVVGSILLSALIWFV